MQQKDSARKAWEKLNPNKTATEQDVSQYLYDGFYNSALEKSEMGTGGSYQRAIQATTAIVQGLSAGNINAALAGAAAPYLANQIAQHIDKEDREARLIAHAVLGAALAAVQKQDIAAGAAGASIGELAGMIAVELKGGRAGELSEADKQTVSALATLASTLAGGLIGDSGATVVNAGLAGKNAVENNHLSPEHQKSRSEEFISCGDDTNCFRGVREHYAEEYETVQKKINTCSSAEDCISIAKELKQWKAENSARSDELTAKIRDKGVDSLTKAEQLEWKNLRSSQSNFDGSINTLLYRAKMFGSSKETTTEIVTIFGHSAIANAAGIAGGAAKANSRGSQGSAIPVPIPQKAKNGYSYQSNPKHTPGTKDFGGSRAGIEPKNSFELFEHSISLSGAKKRFSMDKDGNVHQFMSDGTDTYHWAGSTADKRNPLTLDNKVKSELRKQQGWKLK
ncbi:VENN motif pre-toxin domain-containing protein [Siccibacter turicensis]